jgi:spore germination cell wall hydrolase CwlJ-like protein
VRAAGAGLALLAAASCSPSAKPQASAPQARLTASHLTIAQLQKLAAGADPASLGIAAEAPINSLPAPAGAQAVGSDAQKINASRPFADAPILPMRPFVLKTDAEDKARAVHCLTQAIYYEAAREPLKGQQAVAQVVLNRVRHPAYPKTVCGVVYQGASLPTGCQFTFTCDGSLRWRPEPDLWQRAETVARQALAGYVDKEVGSATHYHAAYVAPYWAPTLVKMTQVGQHIFYRWTGSWGEPAAFTGRYAGRETILTPAVLKGEPQLAPPPERKVTLAVGGEVRTYKVAETSGAVAADGPATGMIHASRRAPSPSEIQRINASLAAMETRMNGGAASVAQAAQPAAAAATASGSN